MHNNAFIMRDQAMSCISVFAFTLGIDGSPGDAAQGVEGGVERQGAVVTHSVQVPCASRHGATAASAAARRGRPGQGSFRHRRRTGPPRSVVALLQSRNDALYCF